MSWKALLLLLFIIIIISISMSHLVGTGAVTTMQCTCSLEAGPDDIEEEAVPTVRLGMADREASQSGGDSAAEGLAPSHSGQYDSAGVSSEGECLALTSMSAVLYARHALS